MATATKARKTRKTPTEEISGSEAIRQILKADTTKAAEVIAAVKARHGLDVSGSLVGAIKGKEGYSKKRRKKRGPRSTANDAPTNGHADDKVSLASLIAAKKLVDGLGGIANARKALEILGTLH